MISHDILGPLGRSFLSLAILAGLTLPVHAQATNPPARKKVSDSRRDEPAEPEAQPVQVKKPDDSNPKKATEPEPVGFFGDPRKFSKLGGWGSFGSGMARFGFARTTLILMPPVQEELKITDEQKKKLQAWQEAMRKKGEEMGRSMREKNGDDPFKMSQNLPITTRIAQFSSLMSQFSSFAKENEAELAKILNAPQRKRLNQISLQMEGFPALVKPEMIEELGLDEDQVRQIQLVINQSQAQQMTTWIGSMMSLRQNRPNSNNPDAEKLPEPPPTSTSTPANASKAAKKKSEPNPAPLAKPDPDPNPDTEAKARLAREKAMKQGFETMRDRTDQIHNQAAKQISQILMKAQIARFEILLGPPFDPRKINNLGGPPRRGEPSPLRTEPKVSPTSDPKTPRN